MSLSATLHRRLAWLNLPAALLITLLQRTPVVRVLAGAGNYVLASPAAQLLRGAVTVAMGGAMHSLAGATEFVISPSSNISGAVGTPISVAFTYTGTPSSPATFQVRGGTLPPGLRFNPTPVGTTIQSGTPTITGTPTQGGSFSVSVQGFNLEGLTNNVEQTITFDITGGGPVVTAPAITTQPVSQSVTVGGAVTFSVAASGSPVPTYQWRKDGTAISGATNASLALTNVQASAAGTYSVLVSNSAGSIVSGNVTLTVNNPPGGGGTLAITAQPTSQTVATGNTVVFNAAATGATSYQWRRNGANLGGATSATLVLNNASAANDGSYSVVVTGSGGATVTSSAATLTVINESNFGRLINLSILTDLDSNGFTMGYVVGPDASPGKPLVIRAAGPSLGALGVPGTVTDPRIELFAGSTSTGANDDWGGSASLTASLAAVGAFPYTGPASLDAAVATRISTRDNSVKVSATNAGKVIAEVYDATPPAAFTASTPRLINVAVNKRIETGTSLTAGFVIFGNTSRTVLVRAVGPGLSVLGVPGTIADPKLVLQGPGGAKFGENDDWGGDAQIAAAFTAVGAFGLPANSKDAVVLVTLAPGNYTADVSGTGAGGTTVIEVYEMP